jgi:hypothetical protein
VGLIDDQYLPCVNLSADEETDDDIEEATGSPFVEERIRQVDNGQLASRKPILRGGGLAHAGRFQERRKQTHSLLEARLLCRVKLLSLLIELFLKCLEIVVLTHLAEDVLQCPGKRHDDPEVVGLLTRIICM